MRHAFRCIVGAVVLSVVAATAASAAYPDRPIRIVVPFAPGGASDIVARLLSVPLTQALGQSIIVENRAGANGNIGIASVAKADADGYTLLLSSGVFTINPLLTKTPSYDPVKDFAPITNIGSSPNVIVTLPSSGMKTLADLIARAKANPNQLNFSSSGAGSVTQLSIELIKIRTGVEMVHVPYSGAGPAVQAVLAGTVPLGGINIVAAIEHIKAGSLVALVQTGKERWPDLPDVPTLGEAGIANADAETFQAMFAPAGAPKDIVALLADKIDGILREPEMRERLRRAGLGAVGKGPDALRDGVAAEVAMWKDVIAKTGISVK